MEFDSRFVDRLKERVGEEQANRLLDSPTETNFPGTRVPERLTWHLPKWEAGARCLGLPGAKYKVFLGLLDAGEAVGGAVLEHLEAHFVVNDDVELGHVKNAADDYSRWCCNYRLLDAVPGKSGLRILLPHALARAVRHEAVERNQTLSDFVADAIAPLVAAGKAGAK